jgi:hypothetical protein
VRSSSAVFRVSRRRSSPQSADLRQRITRTRVVGPATYPDKGRRGFRGQKFTRRDQARSFGNRCGCGALRRGHPVRCRSCHALGSQPGRTAFAGRAPPARHRRVRSRPETAAGLAGTGSPTFSERLDCCLRKRDCLAGLCRRRTRGRSRSRSRTTAACACTGLHSSPTRQPDLRTDGKSASADRADHHGPRSDGPASDRPHGDCADGDSAGPGATAGARTAAVAARAVASSALS